MSDRSPRPGRESARRFVGRVALVTGTGDRGIGGAIAERLAREGAALALVDLAPPERLVKRLERLGATFAFWGCDVTDGAAVERVVAAAADRLGGLDVLVNNAGVGPIGDALTLTDADWLRTLDVNVVGTMRFTRAAIPRLRSPGGVIVNLSSMMASNGCRGYTLYGASKAAVESLTRSLAVELAPRGLRAVAVAPALAHTPMIHAWRDRLDEAGWGAIAGCHPLGMGTTHDVAEAVAFLASSDAAWITGATVPLGWTHQMPIPVNCVLDAPREQGPATSRDAA